MSQLKKTILPVRHSGLDPGSSAFSTPCNTGCRRESGKAIRNSAVIVIAAQPGGWELKKNSIWQTGVTLQALKDYHDMIADVDRRCRRIVSRHPEQIACTKGCAGNCCRIHLTVYPVEAVALARALQAKPPEMRRRIRQQARHTNTFGPCPLLADGACQLYAARAVICRTHGLPVRTEYRGHRSIGFCQKNFRYLSAIPAEDIIDLARLNNRLVDVNRRFVSQMAHRLPPGDRFTIATALLMAV